MYFCNLDIWSADIDTDILNVKPGSGYEGNYPEGGNPGGDQGGNTNPGGGPQKPQWQPFKYSPYVKEDGQPYPQDTSPASVLETYNPTSNIPPQNDKELGVLIDYRFAHYVRRLGYSKWNVSKIFPSNGIIDSIAKQMLLAHIFEHKSDLPTAYSQLDLKSGTPKWDNVKVTSFLINSLNNSQK